MLRYRYSSKAIGFVIDSSIIMIRITKCSFPTLQKKEQQKSTTLYKCIFSLRCERIWQKVTCKSSLHSGTKTKKGTENQSLNYPIWWEEQDSNLRRRSQQIYSLPRLTASVSSQYFEPFISQLSWRVATLRAESQIRTEDPEITNHVLWPTELIRLILYQFFSERCCFYQRLQRKEFLSNLPNIFLKFSPLNKELLFLTKKWVSYLCRTATTAYPCCLPTLGEFSRSWSHRTYPATKVENFNFPPNIFLLWSNYGDFVTTYVVDNLARTDEIILKKSYDDICLSHRFGR